MHPRAASLEDGVDLLLEAGPRLIPYDPLGRLPVTKQNQGGDAQHAEPGGDDGICVDVELHDGYPIAVFGRQILDHRPQHLAGRAPRCPEVHQYRLRRAEDGRLEVLIRRLSQFRSYRHASPWAAQVPVFSSVGFSAGLGAGFSVDFGAGLSPDFGAGLSPALGFTSSVLPGSMVDEPRESVL